MGRVRLGRKPCAGWGRGRRPWGGGAARGKCEFPRGEWGKGQVRGAPGEENLCRTGQGALGRGSGQGSSHNVHGFFLLLPQNPITIKSETG